MNIYTYIKSVTVMETDVFRIPIIAMYHDLNLGKCFKKSNQISQISVTDVPAWHVRFQL